MSISSFYSHFIILIWVLITFCLKGYSLGFPGGASGKKPACQYRRQKRCGSVPELRRSPGGGQSNPLQCSCLENPRDGGAWWAAVYGVAWSRTQLKRLSSSSSSSLSHKGSSAGKESACNVGDLELIPGLGRSPGEGKGYPLQYSGLKNSMDGIVHGVAKSRT